MRIENRYCVYGHFNKKTGQLFYIGHGVTKRRPYARDKYTRSKTWMDYTENHGGFDVKILIDSLSKEDAVEIEECLISMCDGLINSPTANNPKEYPDSEWFQDYLIYSEDSPSGLRWVDCKSVAGSVISCNNKKYWKVMVCGRPFRAHRIVCILKGMTLNKFLVVDHLDGNGLNNKASNLRVCTQKENMRLVQTTGKPTKGVKLHKPTNSWIAYWQEAGEQKTKNFSVNKYGDQAKVLAEQYRAMKVKES